VLGTPARAPFVELSDEGGTVMGQKAGSGRDRGRLAARWPLMGATAVAILAVVGCSSSGGGSDAGTHAQTAAAMNTATASAETSADTPAEVSAQTNAVRVVAVDQPQMAYQITGSPHPGLVSMTFDNQGSYTHEMALVKFKAGATLQQVTAALKTADPQQAAAAYLDDPEREITGPQVIGAHLSETVTANLDAGHYLVICFLPAADGMTHAQMGMVGDFTVSGEDATPTEPETIGTITLTDKGIDVAPALPSGGTFAVTNTGSKPHDVSLAQLHGKPLADFFQCVNASFSGANALGDCPGTLAGGVGTLQPGQTAYLTIHFAPGTYGYVSTAGDGADFGAGLQGTFTVG